jgi:thiamine-monophosphate kinase
MAADARPARRRHVIRRLRFPEPRVALGRRLAGRASAAIDVSDGLMVDLGRLCAAGGVGAVVEWERIPVSEALRAWLAGHPDQWRLPLTAGDDYELLFTVPAAEEARLAPFLVAGEPACARIGTVTRRAGLWLERAGRRERWTGPGGFDHFGRVS